jgi:hypothetical protein
MKLRYTLCFFTLALTACAGKSVVSNGSPSDIQLKQEAASALAAGTAQGDPCTLNTWYGDGTCDSFCPSDDTDCVPAGEPVVCALFAETTTGSCERAATDPCGFQDPDCTVSSPVPGGPGPDDPIACAMLAESSDGVCSRATDDPCSFQDPDCTTGGGGIGCDSRMVLCEMFMAVECPAGEVPSVVDGCYGPCVPQSDCAPIACPAIAMVSDGICSLPATDPCLSIDPDCSVACAEYIEVSDGTCSRPATDPCLFQDPDCSSVTVSCDLSNVSCDMMQPDCPADKVLSVSGMCYGPCVDPSACEPVACAAYIEAPDGICSRPANDPCISQDPDCLSAAGSSL